MKSKVFYILMKFAETISKLQSNKKSKTLKTCRYFRETNQYFEVKYEMSNENRIPTRSQLNKAKKDQLINWCTKYNLPTNGTVKDLILRLREYYGYDTNTEIQTTTDNEQPEQSPQKTYGQTQINNRGDNEMEEEQDNLEAKLGRGARLKNWIANKFSVYKDPGVSKWKKAAYTAYGIGTVALIGVLVNELFKYGNTAIFGGMQEVPHDEVTMSTEKTSAIYTNADTGLKYSEPAEGRFETPYESAYFNNHPNTELGLGDTGSNGELIRPEDGTYDYTLGGATKEVTLYETENHQLYAEKPMTPITGEERAWAGLYSFGAGIAAVATAYGPIRIAKSLWNYGKAYKAQRAAAKNALEETVKEE